MYTFGLEIDIYYYNWLESNELEIDIYYYNWLSPMNWITQIINHSVTLPSPGILLDSFSAYSELCHLFTNHI